MPTTYGLTPTGFVTKDTPTIVSQLQDGYKGVFGSNIPLGVGSMYDQEIGIIAGMAAECWEALQALYLSQFPDTSQGAGLANASALTGQSPTAASYSTTTLTLIGTAGTVIHAGSQIGITGTATIFSTLTDATIPVGGSVPASAQATVIGAVSAPAGTLTNILTPVAGWTSATNAADALVGLAAETDPQFRARRTTQLVVADGGNVSACANYLRKKVAGITFVGGIENRTDVTSGGLSPHSIKLTVIGGADQDVANAIWASKPGGAATIGTQSATVVDSFGQNQTVFWNRGVNVPLYLDVTPIRAADYPADGDTQIKNALVAYVSSLQTGATDGVVANWRLQGALAAIPGITGLTILQGRAPVPTSSANTAIGGSELPTLSLTNIAIH